MSTPAEQLHHDETEAELIPAAIPDSAQEVATVASDLIARAQAFEIATATDLEAAVELTRGIKSQAKELDGIRKTATQPLDKAKAAIMGWFKPRITELEAAERVLKGKMGAYQQRIEEEQRKAAEAEAERIRKNAEARAKRAAEKGDEEAAEDIRQDADMEAQAAAAAIEQAPAPVAPGLSMRDNWKAQVVDMRAFILAVAKAIEDGNPLLHADLLQPNQTELNKLAKALKSNLQGVPGLRVTNDKVSAIR